MPPSRLDDRLILNRWRVEEVVLGSALSLDSGTLSVRVDLIGSPPGSLFEDVTADVVRPDSRVRVSHLLDAVSPAVKPDDPDDTFPGLLGRAGRRRHPLTHRLDGVSVLSSADMTECDGGGEGFPDGDAVLDMGGPGAELSPLARLHHVLLTFHPKPTSDPVDVDGAIRRMTLRTARDIAAVTLDRTDPTVVETVALGETDGLLPNVAVVLQVASEGPFVDTCLNGVPIRMNDLASIGVTDVLDGAITNAGYDCAGLRNLTMGYQDNGLILELAGRHGVDLSFVGVVGAMAYLETPEEKLAAAQSAAGRVAELGASGVIIASFQSGNSHTDTMLLVRECERRGIRTVAILSESEGGLVDHVPEADALVSSGNEDELVPAWTPDSVLGPGTFRDGSPASGKRPLATGSYLGSVEQMGNGELQGADA